MKVKESILKFVSPSAPKDLRLRLAVGERIEGQSLSPDETVTILFILSHDREDDVARYAARSLEEYPATLKLAALEKRLDPAVIKKIVELHPGNEAIATMAALNQGVDKTTLLKLVETGPDELINVFTEEEDKLRILPELAEAIRKNPAATKPLIAAVEDLKDKPAPAEVPKDLVMQKGMAKMDEQNIFKMVLEMKMAQKIKLALTGNKSAREILVKDANKVVATAVLKNPRITEDEVLKVANSKGVSEDILRQIGRNKDWLKNYNVKIGVVTNPKTPLTISMKLLDGLHEKDLSKIAKSKNVASVLSSTARRKLEMKEKK